MGTPGDKAKIEKVVKDEHLDSSEQPVEDTPQVNLPTTQTAEVMGYLSAALHRQTSVPIEKPEIFTSSNLEQARIEDYYNQTKFYPTNFNPPTSYSITQKPTRIFYDIEEPGPSGLQTPSPKTKQPTLTKINAKKKIKQQSELETPKKPYTCQVCQKSYANLDKLNKHQQIHLAISPFKCEHCKKSFSSKFKLVRHMLIHSDRKPFSCTVCERTFHRKDHLKNHIKVHSPTKKVYTCEKEHCKKEYTSLLSYKKHLALHAAQEGSLECQICSSVFRTKDDILFHLKIHAGSRTVKDPNEKKYRCEHCDRKFFTKKDVRRHLVVHTGMRDFLCQFCPQRFGRKDHLGRHIKKSHSKNLPPDELETSSESVKVETVVKSEVKLELDTSEEMYNPLGEGTSGIKYEPTESSQFAQTGLTSDILGYLGDVQDFFPSSDIDKLLEEPVETDLSLMLSTPSRNEFIQILEDINPSTSSSTLPESESDNGLFIETEVLSNPEIQRLLLPSEEINLPLPGFSQTFQSPPPQPPPP